MGEMKRKQVLIADDTRMNRRILSDMLSRQYDVLQAKDGEEAIEVLEKHSTDIAIVLLDIVMPKRDGFDVLEEMNTRGWIEEIPVIMITAEYSEEYIMRANRLGAIDYITKPFNLTIVSFRVASTISMYDKQRQLMNQLTEWADRQQGINPLTGLVYGEAFYDRARQYRMLHREKCELIAIDIEHFKLLNDSYGRARGDEVLKDMAEQLRLFMKQEDVLAGYLGGDDFAIMMSYDKDLERTITRRLISRAKNLRAGVGILPVFGVYIIEKLDKDTVENMYDKACIAASHCLGNYHDRVCEYDHSMMDELIQESDQLEQVLAGLRDDEFTFYLQPQCDMQTGKVVGAEALARWIHNGEMIPPYRFVPVMEKNDIVSDLDFKVWESVCRWLRSWIDRGGTPVPISINVSRLDIYTFDLPAVITELCETYDLDSRYLKVEITESSYVEEFKEVNNAVDTLQDMGFRILMDDFGSGYSSLNMLTNVNIDVLKIDMMFLDLEEGDRKGLDILESVVSMAKLLHLPVVVEGVETKEQLEFLQRLNCDFAQGYYFYKPMSIDQFEELISDKDNVDPNAHFSKFNFVDNEEIEVNITHKEVQDTLFDDFKAIYMLDLEGDHVLALKLSEDIKDIVGYSVIKWSTEFSAVMSQLVDDEYLDDVLPMISREYVQSTFESLREERRIYYRLKSGKWSWMSLHPLRIKGKKTEVALLLVQDMTDIRDVIIKQAREEQRL